jgi:hypothetical protein
LKIVTGELAGIGSNFDWRKFGARQPCWGKAHADIGEEIAGGEMDGDRASGGSCRAERGSKAADDDYRPQAFAQLCCGHGLLQF